MTIKLCRTLPYFADNVRGMAAVFVLYGLVLLTYGHFIFGGLVLLTILAVVTTRYGLQINLVTKTYAPYWWLLGFRKKNNIPLRKY